MFKSIDTIIELTKAGFKPLDTAKPRHFAAIGKFIALVGTEIDAQLKSTLMLQMGSGEELVPRAVINAKAHTAIHAYTDVARAIDQNFYELGTSARQSAVELMTALRLLDAPNDLALREIPLRLKPPPRTRQRRSSRSRARLPPPSPK